MFFRFRVLRGDRVGWSWGIGGRFDYGSVCRRVWGVGFDIVVDERGDEVVEEGVGFDGVVEF